MNLAAAAELVLQEVLRKGLPHDIQVELRCAAEEDVEASGAVVGYNFCNNLVGMPVVEGSLYSLVALLYITQLHEEELRRCASPELSSEQLTCLQSFARRLKSAAFEKSSGVAGTAEASKVLEVLWSDHCTRLGFKVASEVRVERVFDEEARPLGPARGPAKSAYCLLAIAMAQRNEDEAATGGGRKPSTRQASRTAKGKERRSIAGLFDVIAMVTQCEYFVALPSRTEGKSKCKLLAAVEHQLHLHPEVQSLESLKDFIISTYQNVEHDARPWDLGHNAWMLRPDEEPRLVPLTVGDAGRLLRARESNEVVKYLIGHKRMREPDLLSHEMHVTDGTERARLFLLGIDLPVHYHIPVTYADLRATEALAVLSEFAVWRPSAVDKQLRQITLQFVWYEEGASLLVLKPEDYVRAGVPDTRAWKAMARIQFPMVVRHAQTIEDAIAQGLGAAAAEVTWLFERCVKYDTKHRREWLFADGEPGHEELMAALGECPGCKL